MGTSHKHLIWFTSQGLGQGDDELLVSALCGDDLMAPGGAWLRPAGVSRGEGVMLLGYEGVGGGLGFCAVAPPDLSSAWVQNLRTELSLEGAERRWGPFVGQFGRFRSAASPANSAAWLESAIGHDGAIWRARRARHASAAIDCLSRRDRIEAELRLRAAFARSSSPARGDSASTAH
jgi:hypothetical protein